MPTRIALIHATSVAMQPVIDAFHRGWREAETANLLDDALSLDLARALPAVQKAIPGPVLTSPDSAVAKLKTTLEGKGR